MTWETERRVTLHEIKRLLSEFYAKSKELIKYGDPELSPLIYDITLFVVRTRFSLSVLGAEDIADDDDDDEEEGEE